jgi:hypothetical protein
MKRTILVLALASFSIAAFALPPPGGAGTGATLNVNVTNDVLPVAVSNTDPVLVRDTAAAGREIYIRQGAFSVGSGTGTFAIGTVPSGYRLVVEQIGWRCITRVSNECVSARLAIQGPVPASSFARHYLRINPAETRAQGSHHTQTGSELTRLYFAAGDEIFLTVTKAGDVYYDEEFSFVMQGYLEPIE